MKCPRCRIARLVVINVSMQGESVKMHSCSRCDIRWWERDGERKECGLHEIPVKVVVESAA